MSQTTNVQIQVGSQPLYKCQSQEQGFLNLTIPLTCPFCLAKEIEVCTWGSYLTNTGEVARYRCKTCLKTFNPAKIPYWKTKVQEIVWKLAQLAIGNRFSVNALAKMWEVPETTLRTLITEIKEFLAHNLQRAKQLQEQLTPPGTTETASLRIIFYDEGFLKLLGASGFIIFTLTADGTPLTMEIEPHRDAETIHGHFVQAITQLGGIDVIIGDGATAILAAAKALRQPLILVQHIHSGKKHRARIIRLESIPNRKALRQTTIELHTGSLLPNTESKLKAVIKKVYAPTWNSSAKRNRNQIKNNGSPENNLKRSGTLTPEEGAGSSGKPRDKKARLLKGHSIILRTGKTPYEMELNHIPIEADLESVDCPSLLEIWTMLSFVQQALPNQFISSNRAEVFNALHDRHNVYWGRKTLQHANRDLKAWTSMIFFAKASRALIQQHIWHLPHRLLVQLYPLMISKVRIH